MYSPPNKKRFTIGEDESGKDNLEREAYERSYLFSECRPVKELLPLWKQFKKFHKITKFEDWLLQRDKCRKNVYELGLKLGHDFVPHVHQEMCNFYVPKMFDGVYHAEYTLKEVQAAIQKHHYLREQEMLLLAPRGSFKSTTNCVDCVSWMLNCPDIRIMILSGEYKLADKFLKTVKGYFSKPEDGDPTSFQQLFPEYIISEADGLTMSPLFCPARKLKRGAEATVWVNSIGSSLSGWHCDILKGDDVVTDENSNTEGTRESVNEKWTGCYNLLDEWGFVDNIGTRYYPDDAFGERLRLQEELPLKFLRRAAWTVLPAYADVKIEDLQEHMVLLYFPEKLSFKSLRSKLLRNKQQFLCQQMNLPAGGDDDLVHFDEDVLRAAHEQYAVAPQEGDVYIAFDTSSGSASGDFSAGAACRFETRSDGQSVLHNIDNVYGKWRPSELAIQIVNFAIKWSPRVVIVEDWAQSELVFREISRLATERGIHIPLLPVKRSMEFNAKKNRIKGLEILLASGRIKFVGGWWTDELMKQFTRYTGDKVRRRHDDIPDAISYLQKFLPDAVATSEYVALREAEQKRMREEQFASHVFRAPVQTPLSPLLQEVEADPSDIDQRFFGGMGLYRN